MSQDATAAAYYEERITISLSRIQLLTIVSACMLALKHPDIPKTVKTTIMHAMRDLTPLIDRYAPADTLNEWAQTLRAS